MNKMIHENSSTTPFIQPNQPLAEKTWFKTGGIARFYAEPKNAHEFTQALRFAEQKNIEVFILGSGANILISDEGFNGLVIKPMLTSISATPDADPSYVMVTAQAGVSVPELILYCLDRNMIGLEEFAGIPGTVGGSTYINIHYFEFLLSHFISHATVIHTKTGDLHTVDKAWFNFNYNTSTLLAKEYYLVDATFKVTQVTAQKAAYARGRHDEIIRHRNRRYPHERTCGSFFRNFLTEELKNGMTLPFVAHYLELLGIKGTLRSGKACVFSRHANMIVTEPGATSNDVVQLAITMQERVFEKFGLLPQPECQLIGFKKYPLKTI